MRVRNAVTDDEQRRFALLLGVAEQIVQFRIGMGGRLGDNALVVAGLTHGVQLAAVALDDRHAARLGQRQNLAHARALRNENFITSLPGAQQFGHCIAAFEQGVLLVRIPVRLFVLWIVHFQSISPKIEFPV